MIKALLIDDEERATDSLQLLIERFIPDIKRVWCCNDATKAAQLIHDIQPDLIFLDIRMPHLSGFDLLNTMPNKRFKIIFTTAYDEYAIKSIRFSAFDYLLKPIDAEELIHAINRFVESKEGWSEQQERFRNMTHNLSLRGERPFRLALPSKDGIHFLTPYEIIRCEAVSNYTRFYTANNKQLITSKTLGEYAELLGPYHFIRTHKSHLVNRDYISFIDHEGFVVLKDASKVEVSRRRKQEVLELLKA